LSNSQLAELEKKYLQRCQKKLQGNNEPTAEKLKIIEEPETTVSC
jgi:hypothetical protein